MELYFAPYACSMVVRIVADEARAALAYREVDLYTKRFADTGSDYLAVNPRGQVPVLVMDTGETLAEVSAIVDRLGTASGLMGSTERERSRVLEGLSFAATEIHKRVLFVLGTLASPPEVRAHARSTAPIVFAELARTMGARPFYAGERFTAADAYFAWAFLMARTFRLDPAPVEAYARRLAVVPAAVRALEVETPLALASWRRQEAAVGAPPWLR